MEVVCMQNMRKSTHIRSPQQTNFLTVLGGKGMRVENKQFTKSFIAGKNVAFFGSRRQNGLTLVSATRLENLLRGWMS